MFWDRIYEFLEAFGATVSGRLEHDMKFLVPAAVILGGILVVVILTKLLFYTQWRSVRVFISYKNEYTEIAKELKHFFENQAKGFRVEMLAFAKRQHDETVSEVRDMIRRSDIMVCIPDPEAPSFVNAEILAMSVLGKPIVLVRHHKDQQLPHTALSGYPVLELEKLRKYKLKPLADYCTFICRHFRDLDRFFSRLLVIFGIVELAQEFRAYIIVVVLLVLAGLSSLKALLSLGLYLLMISLLLGVIIQLIAIFQERLASKVARQQMLSGHTTFQKLNEALSELPSDWRISECLDEEALPTKHI